MSLPVVSKRPAPLSRLVLVLGLLAPAVPVWADAPGIENIVVTTERRVESAQDVGAAISVFSFDDLERQNVQDIYELQLSVPSLVATGGLPNLTLRGIGNDIVAQGVDPGFALHTNGVYATQMASALLDFYDLERVEVLYGPQGTLFGRSTTGGTVNFITKRPTDELELMGDLEWASYEKLRLRSTVNLPLLEDFAARLTWAHELPSKPFHARGIDQEFGNNSTGQGSTLRAALAWTPSEDFRADGFFSWSRDNTPAGTVRYLGDYPDFPAGQSPLFGIVNGSPDYDDATPNSGKVLRPRLDLRQSSRVEVVFGQAMLEWTLGDLQLKSNSAYQYWDYQFERDQDSSDVLAERLILNDKNISWTQELTLQSQSDHPLQWLVGANYQHSDSHTLGQTFNFQADADAANFLITDVTTGLPADRCGGPCVFAPLDGRPQAQLDGRTLTRVFGGFANLWYEVNEQIRLSGGLRYSYTDRDFEDLSTLDSYSEPLDLLPFDLPLTAFLVPLRGDRILDAGDGSPFNSTPKDTEKSWNSLTGHARFEFKPTDESLLYASFAVGERHGGFNWLSSLGSGTLSGFDESFDSEKILAYEIGSKNLLFDGRLLLNLSAFYYDYEDKFIFQQIANVAQTVNVPSAEVFGLELNWVALPFENLRINGSFGWLDAKYDSDFFSQDNSVGPDNPTGYDPLTGRHGPGVGGDGRPPENINGNPLNQSPRYSFHLGAEYHFDLGARGSLSPRIDFSWRDEIYFKPFRDPKDRQDAYHQTNLRLRWESASQRWWLEGFVQNLENDREIKTNLEGENKHRQWWLAPPRIFGLRTGFRFTGLEAPWR